MKYLIGIGIFALGGVGGYIIGSYSSKEDLILESPPTEFVTQTVHDTIVETQIVNVPEMSEEVDSTQILTDSLQIDSLIVEIPLDSGEIESDISIRREKLISTVWVGVDVLKDITKDTLANQLIGVEQTFPTKMLVEFWESPLNFSGYKLSRNKLVMFGMPDNLVYKILRNETDYFITTENIYYSIKETEEFLPYLEVQKEEVFDD
ncbi:MAG: hypothetical protein BM555_05525 [Crocinitomix sp. MedPE-SWsnd]|nr:MAG: hypothetical protein BM555_05525 [Crocinitomix sp. MedPE-SWsnd]